jgi:hypothetical protein
VVCFSGSECERFDCTVLVETVVNADSSRPHQTRQHYGQFSQVLLLFYLLLLLLLLLLLFVL